MGPKQRVWQSRLVLSLLACILTAAAVGVYLVYNAFIASLRNAADERFDAEAAAGVRLFESRVAASAVAVAAVSDAVSVLPHFPSRSEFATVRK